MAFYAIFSSFSSSSSSTAPSLRSRRVPDDFDSELLVEPPPDEGGVGRDVYLVRRPLDVPIEEAYLAHWAVKVGDYVHELVNVDGFCQYKCQRYDRGGPWPKEERRGATTFNDAAVILAAIKTIKSNREYDPMTNNCQHFAWRLMNRLTGQTTTFLEHHLNMPDRN
ncbi:hypothetical protein DFH08DRAFT_867138 [Mycena albidolilacea]|uniref:Uncharacterized protein n=1 Tax=Mycena albidolilacea TaxID=1033008 RepID=A0AAD7ER61_9AGAR|nr:hypothetical protein DFH08DRAFT_867138 [Mycena albidolilacea]